MATFNTSKKLNSDSPGANPGGGGGAPGAPLPLKLEKDMIFWRKIVIFYTIYPKMFAPPSARRIFF